MTDTDVSRNYSLSVFHNLILFVANIFILWGTNYEAIKWNTKVRTAIADSPTVYSVACYYNLMYSAMVYHTYKILKFKSQEIFS